MFFRNKLSLALQDKMAFLIEPVRPSSIKSHDRFILERKIFPYILSNCKKVLFVGCAKYTKSYNQVFSQIEYWTMDFLEAKSRYGSKNHVQGNLTELSKYFKKDYFNAIILNSVIGWGVDTAPEIKKALVECNQVMRPGGILIIGWNDLGTRSSKEFREMINNNRLFELFDLPTLNTYEYRTESHRHVFNFLRKPSRG